MIFGSITSAPTLLFALLVGAGVFGGLGLVLVTLSALLHFAVKKIRKEGLYGRSR